MRIGDIVEPNEHLIDIHCHLLPDLDDGAQSWLETTQMARMAVADGIRAVVATPHQLGVYAHNGGEQIRERTRELQAWLARHEIPLRVAPGAQIRCEPGLPEKIEAGEVLTLADQGRHVLLELPPAPFPLLHDVLPALRDARLTGIIAHPERHGVLQRNRDRVADLVDRGCLMQVTADSLVGLFGYRAQQMAEWMLNERLVHFLATDAHGAKSRRPLLRQAFTRVASLVDYDAAVALCCRNPAAVVAGEEIPACGLRRTRVVWSEWFRWRRAA